MITNKLQFNISTFSFLICLLNLDLIATHTRIYLCGIETFQSTMFFSYFFLVISSFYICCYVLFVKRQKKGFLFHIVDLTKNQKLIESIIDMCVYEYVCPSFYQIILYFFLDFFMLYILPIYTCIQKILFLSYFFA
jgi:hypothetical protein